MEISISSLVAQIINFAIMFFLFSRFAAKPLSNQIEDRRKLIAKIKKADELYKEKIDEAEGKAHGIIQNAMTQKDKILTEGETLALKQQVEIVNEANHNAEKIILEAKYTGKVMEQELEKKFVEAVKTTSKSVVKKLLQKDIDLQHQYVEELVKQSIQS